MKKAKYKNGTSRWVTKLGKDVHIEMLEIGMAVQHNLFCWLCNENHAVYSMNPEWVFKPCWECQSKLGLYGVRIKKWYQFWK